MKQGFPIATLGLYGLLALTPHAATADSAPARPGAPIVLAKATAPSTARPSRMRQSLAALSREHTPSTKPTAVPANAMTAAIDFPADDLFGAGLAPLENDGFRKRNLEFSSRTGPKLRIGLKQKKVRFALNFKVVDDVFFAPAYRLAISRADFQNPEGYWAHSVFFGMRFHFNSDAK